MNMVRHDYERNHYHTFAFEMVQSFRHDLRAVRSSQKTHTMSRIEPVFDRARKALVILTLNLARPRLGMHTQPSIALILPLVAEPCGDRVSEPEGDEIDRSLLLPMRQAILRVPDFRVRIEEAQLGHLGRTRES
jgi:hypothetical protein